MTTLDGATPGTARPPADRPARPWYQRPLPAGLVLLAVYVALSFLNDPRGTLGTDTGIKVATLKVMEERGSWTPDLGYWAATLDPDAEAHPYRDTRRMGDAYVDASTLPLLYLAYPLWTVGGYRATLLWPMAGAVAAAFVARGLARRVGGTADGWPAFWLAGLASPLAIYALDLWEHTLGVAAMGTGVLVLYDLCRPDRDDLRWWRGAVAGVLFGAAYTMRTEALVYTVASFAVAAVVLALRRRWTTAVAAGVAGIAGFGVLAVANGALEQAAVGGLIRSARASGTAAGVGSDLRDRVREGVVTLTSPFGSFDPTYLLLGLLGSAALVAAAVFAGPGGNRVRARIAAATAAVVAVMRLASGPGFWPGMLAASPMAAVGLGRGWNDRRERLLLAFALVPVPLVLAFQYTGGALPQWGGRYLLTSGFVLAAVGAAALPELVRWARIGAVALSVAVTALGLTWMAIRTHQVAAALAPLGERPEEILIWSDGFLPREFAAAYGEDRWLAGASPDRLDAALDVAGRAAPATIGVVTTGPTGDQGLAPAIPGYHVTGTSELPFLDPVNLIITSYAADAR
jgi:hypothetical protein